MHPSTGLWEPADSSAYLITITRSSSNLIGQNELPLLSVNALFILPRHQVLVGSGLCRLALSICVKAHLQAIVTKKSPHSSVAILNRNLVTAFNLFRPFIVYQIRTAILCGVSC